MAHTEPTRSRSAGSSRRFSAGQVLAIVLAVLVLIFALVNLERVTVDFVVAQFTLPLFFVIAFTGLIGVVVGLLLQRHRRRARG